MIDAWANFKLCELNSFYQRRWWVTGAQLEGPDKTCAHLCLHAFHALSTSTHCKRFDNDELLINDRLESRVVGGRRLSCLRQWYRCHWGRPDVMSSSWIGHWKGHWKMKAQSLSTLPPCRKLCSADLEQPKCYPSIRGDAVQHLPFTHCTFHRDPTVQHPSTLHCYSSVFSRTY